MSWDVCAYRFPANCTAVDDIPGDFEPPSLGSRADVVEIIRNVVPGSDFSDPSWGIIDGDNWSIEVSLSEDDVQGLTFFCRGNSEKVIEVIFAICGALDVRPLDLQTSEFLVAGADAEASFAQWRAYRDQILEEYRDPGST